MVTLKSPTTKEKKQHKVAFTESSSEQSDSISSNDGSGLPSEKCHSLTNSSTTPTDVDKLYNGCLLELVCNVCTLCLDKVSQTNSVVHLNLLSCLVPHFTSTQLIKTLYNASECSSSSISLDEDNYCTLSEQFLNHILFPWIKLSCEQFLSIDQRGQDISGVFTDVRSVDYVIAIFCGIIRTLPVGKQEELVSKSLQVSLWYCLFCFAQFELNFVVICDNIIRISIRIICISDGMYRSGGLSQEVFKSALSRILASLCTAGNLQIMPHFYCQLLC